MVLSRSWTPATLPKITDRIDPHGGVSVAVLEGSGRNAHRWWFVWSDPARESREDRLRNQWAVELVSSLYHDRRKPSALSLGGPLERSQWREGFRDGYALSRAVPVYVQARPGAFRSLIEWRAAAFGLKIASFRAPRLGGILAPLVVLQVTDQARFERWYEPGCSELHTILGPTESKLLPYFGLFLTITDVSGDWMESSAVFRNGASTDLSPRMWKRYPPPMDKSCHRRLPPRFR